MNGDSLVMPLPAPVARWILEAEGGHVSDPDDPGGETKYGISQRAYPAENISELTPQRALELYERDYFDPVRGELLPEPLALAVFDGAVNHGVGRSVRMLQAALVRRFTQPPVVVDGLMGPKTVAAALDAWAADPEATLHEYLGERALLYARLSCNTAQAKFLRGWMLRLFRLEAECLRMGEA